MGAKSARLTMLLAALLAGIWCMALVAGAARAQEIGAVLAGSRGTFWEAMRRGIVQGGSDFGVSVVVRGTVDDDAETARHNPQLRMIDYMLGLGARAIVLAPIPLHGVKVPVALPVPVVFVDRASTDFKAMSVIATDNHGAGRAAALSLQGVLVRTARVGVLRLAPHVVSTTARETGFIEAATEIGFDVMVDAYLGHDVRTAREAASRLLAPHRGWLGALFMPTPKVALAVLVALQAWPAEQRPLLVGFDYEPELEVYLRNGDLYAIVVQDPFQMGYRAVQQLVELRHGQPIPAEVPIHGVVVTGANIDEPGTKAALSQFRE